MPRATSRAVVEAVRVMPLPVGELWLVLSFKASLVAQSSVSDSSVLVLTPHEMGVPVSHS